MHFIDLTHLFSASMPVFPGDPDATLTEISRVSSSGCADHLLHTGMHVGTHIDAPAHMLMGGGTIDAFPLALTHTRGCIVDARGASALSVEVFQRAPIEPGMTVVVVTGWSERFRSEHYFDFKAMPLLDEAAARYLAERRIACLALDTPTPDTDPFPAHKILLKAGIYIIENVRTPERLLDVGAFECVIVPMAFHADAAPVRFFARVFGGGNITLGRYRHYKGGEYIVKSIARHSESLEPLVVYESCAGHGTWVRPLSMFLEMVTTDNGLVPRFERIGE